MKNYMIRYVLIILCIYYVSFIAYDLYGTLISRINILFAKNITYYFEFRFSFRRLGFNTLITYKCMAWYS